MRNSLILLVLVLSFINCKNTEGPRYLKKGMYRAALVVEDNEELPFIFQVKDSVNLEIFNAEEVIKVENIKYEQDSVFIQAPVFEGYIGAKIDDNGNLTGHFNKESLGRVVPFTAEYKNDQRFKADKAVTNVSGIWETVFSQGIEGDEYIAKGIFEQKGNKVTGTFRTTTGDYRFLEGVMDGDVMKVSAFDGAHAFLFVAKVGDSTMTGQFYSGNHWKEPFVAKRNENYELPSPDSLTFLKEGYDALAFEFPDSDGNIISLEDDQFKNKVVVVQI
ncbi:MAG: TlpA family protein disulfide reductase, partial [Bacteroidota bacterium]